MASSKGYHKSAAMGHPMLHQSIQALLQETPFLTQTDIAKKLKKDKVRVSGYLQALADLGI
jgi:predicted transcriptional regulator